MLPFLSTEAIAAPIQPRLQLYLMDVWANDHRLAESTVVYQSGEDFFVHFVSFLEAIEFPIQKRGRTWSGWFRAKENRFIWNMDSGHVQLNDDRKIEPRNTRWIESDEGTFILIKEDLQWIETDEGIFVAMKALETWFDLKLTPNTHQQTITVVSSNPLPFQQRAARATARYAFHPGERPIVAITIPDQYRWATLPLIDLSSDYRAQNDGRQTRSGGLQTSVTAGMDLFKHSLLYTGSTGGDGGDGRQRLTIKRAAPTPQKAMFLGARQYTLGDIFAINSNLVSSGGDGMGFRIERRHTGRASSLNLVTIAGDATPRWEIELYRNGVLITFGSVGEDGRYVFPHQETVYGENIFLVRLFGPQGQVDEKHHIYWGGGIELPEGDYNFSISHIDFSHRLLDGERNDVNGLASARTTDIRYAYALTRNLQLGAAYTWASLGSRAADGTFLDSEYATLDGRMNLGPGLLLAELVEQQRQGHAWALQYLTTLSGQHISLSHRSFSDFESPYTVRKTKLNAQNQITMSGQLSSAGINSYTLRFTHQDRADGRTDYRIFNRLGVRWGPVIFSNDLEYFRITEGNEFYLGHLRISGRRNRFSFNGQLDYDPVVSQPINQISGTLRWNVNRRIHNTLTVAKALKNNRILRLDNTLSMRVGNLNLSFSVNVSSDNYWAVGLGVNTRFGYDRELTRFITADHSLAHTGRATLNLFIDSNNNGVREPSESPVSWAAYNNERIADTAPGVLKLSGVPANNAVRLQTRHFRFDDPFLSPRSKAYEIYTHAGSDIHVNVPVVVTGDVDGYLIPTPGGREADVRGLKITLYNADGEEIAVTHSEFDGYYSFHAIPVGQYQVVVRPYADKPGYHMQQFSLDADKSYQQLDAIYIWRR